MQPRQTWKTKILVVLRLLGSSTKASKNEELKIPPSTTYSDDSDGFNSDTEVSIKTTSSDLAETIKSSNNTIASKDLRECNVCKNMRSLNWCKTCESKEFAKHFSDWTSNNELLNKFIRNTQYKSYDHRFYWEWIPFNQFSNVQLLANESVFTAIWLKGPRNHWNNERMLYVRRKWCKVVLKRLVHSPDNIEFEFINQLRSHYGRKKSRCERTVQFYGMTLDPETNCYMLVTEYHNKRDIRTSLQENYSELTWSDKLRLLHECAEALLHVHSKGLTHKNLHTDLSDFQFKREDFEIHPDAIYTSRPLVDLLSREFELRDQFRNEAELSEQNELEGSSTKDSEEIDEIKDERDTTMTSSDNDSSTESS
ncbi:4100_t:CDS:2 [Funneliformis mosseae]|uniref:4100_t:CDS:1 n=1 Tax=Funneliformis mosseae TaxID=27381 RepID=A0A9N9HH94_FUNMO|nr:4100_t:CDS:2 [Funneliformis mosseae]